MTTRTWTRPFAALALVAAIASACTGASGSATTPTVGGSSNAVTASPSTMSEPSMAPQGSGTAMSQPFGTACSAVPTTGAGSFSGMAEAPVATAASHNPVLSTLVSAVTAAKLGDTLNSANGITVFAPTNDAFAAVPKATLDKAMGDPAGLLTTVLTYHVVPGRLTPDQLAGTHKTLEGQQLTIAGSGESFTVNGSAKVVCGDVQTANATVYIIDGVLLPPAK